MEFKRKTISVLRKKTTQLLEERRLLNGFDLESELDERYFVTTEQGIFLIGPGEGRLLTRCGGYGFGFYKDMAYFSIDKDGVSSVCSLPRELLLDKGTFRKDKYSHILYEVPTKSSNGRIHQLTITVDGHLLFANTGRNSIVRLAPETGDIEEITPFPDRFGEPILDDHNHINSVVEYDGMIFFVAYKAGDKSLIGCIKGPEAKGFFYENQGGHDIYKTNSGFLFLDTFGQGKGHAITENGRIYTEFLGQGTGYVLRGGAGNNAEWILGHSHKGPRKKRFEGRGGLIVIKQDRCSYVELPAAQIYQIIRYDGHFFDYSHNEKSLLECLISYFGEPGYTARTSSLPENGSSIKLFDVTLGCDK